MKKIFTVGVYDLLHIGHILLFRNAKALGDLLIVAVQESDVIKKYKPQAQIINDTDKRMFMVHSIRYVDDVIVYQDVDTIVRQVDFDIFVTGPDQNHAGFERAKQWCLANGKEVVVLPRTEGISSTMLRNVINSTHGKEL